MQSRSNAYTRSRAIKLFSPYGYKIKKLLGQGVGGTVYHVVDSDKHEFAIKYIQNDQGWDDQGISCLSELDILARVNHPYIIRPSHVLIPPPEFTADRGVGIVMPKVDTLMSVWPILAFDEQLEACYKIALAIAFLHDHHILHLDVKVQNIMMDIDCNPMLIDFGNSLVVGNITTGILNDRRRTPMYYRCPELLRSPHNSYLYNAPVDVWSYGIMLLKLFSGQDIYNPNIEVAIPRQVAAFIRMKFSDMEYAKSLLTKNKDCVHHLDKILDLLSKVLSINYILRATMEEVCQHVLFEPYCNHDILGGISTLETNDDNKSIEFWILYIIKTVKNNFGNRDVSMLFLAVDLFYRSVSINIDATLCITCVWMAAKLTNNDNFTLPEFLSFLADDISVSAVVSKETDIVVTLKGILNVCELYNACVNATEMRTLLERIMVSDVNEYRELTIGQLRQSPTFKTFTKGKRVTVDYIAEGLA